MLCKYVRGGKINTAIIEGTFSDNVGKIFNNCRLKEKWQSEKNLGEIAH